MKILIDCTNLKLGGGIQVALSFISDLSEMKKREDNFIVLTSKEVEEHLNVQKIDKEIKIINFKEPNKFLLFYRGIKIKKIENKIEPDVIFTIFGPSYHKSNFPKVVGYAIPHYIYENSPFFKSINLKQKVRLYLLKKIQIFTFLKNSDALIFETKDAEIIFKDKFNYKKLTYVVPNTLNQIFYKEEEWKDFPLENLNKKRVLCLTANYPHKNLKIIPQILDFFYENNIYNVNFLISLNKEDLGFNNNYNKNIEYIGRINLSNLPSLYKQVDLLFMPTLLEVFSTTYLEAMFMKKPIVASDMSFAKNICGESAIYFDSENIKDAAIKIIKILEDQNLIKKIILEGEENLKKFGTSLDRTNKYLNIISSIKK